MSPLLNYFEILDQRQWTADRTRHRCQQLQHVAMLGWDSHAIGYHTDNGKLFHQSGYGKAFGPNCKKGDVMGCGIDFTTDCGQGYVKVWFTKNGDIVGPSEKMKRPLHGSIPSLACTVSRRRSGTEDTLTEAQTHHRMIWKQT